jgi:hypothetical protein
MRFAEPVSAPCCVWNQRACAACGSRADVAGRTFGEHSGEGAGRHIELVVDIGSRAFSCCSFTDAPHAPGAVGRRKRLRACHRSLGRRASDPPPTIRPSGSTATGSASHRSRRLPSSTGRRPAWLGPTPAGQHDGSRREHRRPPGHLTAPRLPEPRRRAGLAGWGRRWGSPGPIPAPCRRLGRRLRGRRAAPRPRTRRTSRPRRTRPPPRRSRSSWKAHHRERVFP